MNQIKIKKASEPSEVAIELFKAGADKCLKYLTKIFHNILFKNKLPEKWMLSSLVPIFKGKGDPLGKVVDIDKMQYGFMSGRGTVNAVFVLQRLSEKFRAKHIKLFFKFDLEKALDCQGKLFVLLQGRRVSQNIW